MKFWRFLRLMLLFTPLALTVALTLMMQTRGEIDNFFSLFFLAFPWSVLILGWLARFKERRQNKEQFVPKRMWVLPFCVVFLLICQATQLPLRVMFWTHKPALQRALNRPVLERQLYSQAPRIGLFRPLQIAKSKGATRFLLWESGESLFSDYAIGFAHCPGDAGCSRASFTQFYEGGEAQPQTVPLGDGWFRYSILGSDF